jgi:sodium pump decarboxylase gamma subunit
VRPVNENIAKFKNEDGTGIWLTIMSMGVVFLALLLLYILFKLFGKAFSGQGKEKKEEETVAEPTAAVAATGSDDNDEAIAALCMALYQHLNAHDEESGVLTFDHSHEGHSAWGSKGNLLLHMPERHENH